MARRAEKRPHQRRDWSLLGRCFLWCLVAALGVTVLVGFDLRLALFVLLIACPVGAVWLYLASERPLPLPVGTCGTTRGRTHNWLAPWYDRCCARMGITDAFRVRLIELSGIHTGDQVLDLGCGTGKLACLAAYRAGESGRVTGIDAAPDMIRLAQQQPIRAAVRPRFEPALAEALPFADGTFDVVLASFLFSALPRDLKGAALHEVSRVLKPGGRLVVADLRRPSGSRSRIAAALFRLSAPARDHLRGQTADILRSGGFEPRLADNWGTLTGIWICAKTAPSGNGGVP